MDTNQQDHTAAPLVMEDEAATESAEGFASSGHKTVGFVKQVALPRRDETPLSSNVRKAQVRAALFRKLEPIKVGRFILLEPLGAGAMGEIYAAYDDQLDRKVALKLVRGGSALTVKADDRLLREAQTLAQVSHPNVVQIYEAGTYNGRLFIAMELIRGKTLSSWLKDAGQVPRAVRQREILRQFIAAGRGLEAAHAAGVAHRDFKPDNVLVGDDGRVRVVDFGLARALVDEPDGEGAAWSRGDADSDGAPRTSEPSREEISQGETVTGDNREGGDVARLAAKAPTEDLSRGQTVTMDSDAARDSGAASSNPLVADAATIDQAPVAVRAQASRAATGDPLAKPGRASTSDPAPGTPKLKAALRLTETGTVMGTPRFMAPEQMRGAIADHRSDQFSFCVALYHALYDAFPFSGDSWQELRAAMESGEVEVAPSVPVAAFVRRALRRGLAVDPSQRFASMGELLAALEPRGRRRRTWIAAAAGLSVVVLGAGLYLRSSAADPCAAAGTAIDAAWSADRQVAMHAAFLRSEQPFAEVAWRGVQSLVDGYTRGWRNEATGACQATNIAHTQSAQQLDKRMLCLDRGRRQLAALVTELGTGAPGAVEHAIEATEALPDLEACRRAENLMFGLAPPTAPGAAKVAAIRDQLARALTLEQLGRYDESLVIARDASTTTARLGYPPVHAEALAQIAHALDARGTADARAEAERLYFEALDIAEAERHDQLAVEIWNRLGMLAMRMDSSMAQAHAWWRRNAAAVRRIGDDAYEQAKLHHVLGEIYFREGKYAQAADEEKLAIAAITRSPAHQLELSRYDDALAKSLERLDHLDEAMRLHERALAMATDRLGASHLNVIELQTNYGRALMTRGQFDRARAVLEDALRNMTARDRDAHPDAAKIHTFLSDIDAREGHLDRAAEHAHASLAIYQRTQSPDHLKLAEAYMNLANIEERRGNSEAALAILEDVLALRRRYLGDDHYQTGLSEAGIAETLVELERYADALPHVREAERILVHGSTSVRGSQAWILIVHGELLVGQGQFGAAIPVLEQAMERFGDGAGDPTNHALAMWTLARALDGLGRDGDRVRSLAEQARTIFTALGAMDARYRDAVARFLDRLPARQAPRSLQSGSGPTR